MSVSASALRNDIYKLLDSVLETGVPLEIERKGRILKVVAEEGGSKWDRMVERTGLNCSGDDLVETSWEEEWRP